MYFIGVDPSIIKPGLVILNGDRKIVGHTDFRPRARDKTTVPEKIDILKNRWDAFWSEHFHGMMGEKRAVVIEEPGLQTSEKGLECSASGGLIKLAASFGAFVAFSLDVARPDFIFSVSPRTWKGQVPKKITRNRMVTKYRNDPEKVYDFGDDEIDALGLADWLYEKNRHQPLFEGKTP